MRIIALGAMAIAITSLLASGTAAIDPPAPYASTMPSYRPSIELPGVYKPQVQGPQGYAGFDTPRVCGNTSLSASDRTRCERDMSQSATEAARSDVRQRYEAKVRTPPPAIAEDRPSAAPVDTEQVANGDAGTGTPPEPKRKVPAKEKQPPAKTRTPDTPAY